MKLRQLCEKDASEMYSWMHDKKVTRFLQTDFAHKTLQDCIEFIYNSEYDTDNLHMAITVDDNYLGTVSLKHIDLTHHTAEFAITITAKAMGKGISKFAMKEILNIGIRDLKLSQIYWCVNQDNLRAIRFYDKNNYCRTDLVPEHISSLYSESIIRRLIWYRYEAEKEENI